MKKARLKTAHTDNTQQGMGDYYGRGVRNPMGRLISGMGVKPVTPSNLKKPPRKLA